MRVEYVDHMGTDLSVVNAARVSFDKVSDWEINPYTMDRENKILKASDTKLLHYLAKHDHWTPFAHTAITLRMQAPIPIRTQCFKHKVGFIENEESRRYISGAPSLFVPDSFRSRPEGSIKQGSAGVHPKNDFWRATYEWQCRVAITQYEDMIADGVAPEQARLILPQGVEVNWIWTGNLVSYANFYNKRTEDNAQVEIQQLAYLVRDTIEPLFPVSWRALTEL